MVIQPHLPAKGFFYALVLAIAFKVVDAAFGTLIESALVALLPAGWLAKLSGLSFWWGGLSVFVVWGLMEVFSPRTPAQTSQPKPQKPQKRQRSDAPVKDVATYIYERTGWKPRDDNHQMLQLGTEIADRLAAGDVRGWARRHPAEPLNEHAFLFWRDATVDIAGAFVTKRVNGGVMGWHDLHLSWAQVKKVWPSRYPTVALPLLQRLGIARKMQL